MTDHQPPGAWPVSSEYKTAILAFSVGINKFMLSKITFCQVSEDDILPHGYVKRLVFLGGRGHYVMILSFELLESACGHFLRDRPYIT